ncbi:MAG: hypothetical protein J5582_14230 [Ruminococcus sp.]|uniref:hypothetical protein n=1 Tax=Ruminococcus sp. TaxID=41978 RepID=UPI0025EC03E5|nr:hypothetical protein [Ruminococcus sp.]MBO4867694.1 hypothetical protein [Ruminococcus sp.]
MKAKKNGIVIAAVILLLTSLCLYFFINIHLDFKEVAEGQLLPNRNYTYYCDMRSETEREDVYGLSDEFSGYDYDFDGHTYIVTFGYELEDISYSRASRPIVSEHGYYNYHVPNVWLSSDKTDKCYVYELPKVNIGCDADNYKRKVYFVEK